MKIHHVTIPARNPSHVANVLAEILGAKVSRLPHPLDNHLVYAGDADGSAIEVWPVGTRGGPLDTELCASDLPMPERWPHHAYITTTHIGAAQILEIFTREGWYAQRVHNGAPGFGFELVRGWIENQAPIELGGQEMAEQYANWVRRAAGGAA